MLTKPKLKDPYLFVSYHYYLLQAHQVSCNSAKRLRRNAIKPLCRVRDDLYHACTFAWGILHVLFTPHWKMLQCCNKRHSAPFRQGFCKGLERSITGRVFSRDILKGGNIGVRASGRLGGILSFGKYNTLLLLPI